MGAFYVNYTLRGAQQQAVARALKGRNALVSPVQDGCLVVFDGPSEMQANAGIEALGRHLSGEIGCPVLAVQNHDDVLTYWLFTGGGLVDHYVSDPGNLIREIMEPSGGDARALCAAFRSDRVAETEAVLRAGWTDEGKPYVFETERHHALALCLGIPLFCVGFGTDTSPRASFQTASRRATCCPPDRCAEGPPAPLRRGT